jgi:hypothetical protein
MEEMKRDETQIMLYPTLDFAIKKVALECRAKKSF